MRLWILIVILIASLVGSGFLYGQLHTVCNTPVHYRIGTIDERFGTNQTELRQSALHAEALWEKPLHKDLFVYDENASLPINLTFDTRQENALKELELREDLQTKAGMSESVSVQYEKLITQFRALKKQYESRVIAYQTALDAYNIEVETWNKKGGAPPEKIQDLRDQERVLQKELTSLQTLSDTLNKIIVELNKIGSHGNALVTDYNTIVSEYNKRFGEGGEFTQGDYTGTAIDIYQFDSKDELSVVLAHEFGHALSLNHVANEKSIMFHLMENQNIEDGLTQEDIAEYTKICVQKTGLFSFLGPLLSFIQSLHMMNT